MKIRTALIAIAILVASPLLAQTPSAGMPPKPPAHQPGVPAQPAQPAPTQTQKAAPPAATTAPSAPEAKLDPAKDAAIRHLMEITQTSKMGDTIDVYVTSQVRQVLSQAIPPDRLAKLMDGFTQRLPVAAPPNAVTDAAVLIYARSFSMEDIQGITQFYETPLGQRVVKALPQVARESQELGVQMQQKGAMSVLQDLSSEYPELKQMLRPPDAAPDAAPSADKPPAPKPAPAPPSK
jgi:uncharacterized protein